MAPVKVVIVDDSPTIRAVIRSVLSEDPEIEVVAEAGDPYEAREAIKRYNPDVITLDIEMPRMNGLDFLEKIMRLRPMPVIMISTLTQEGAKYSIEALSKGAFDCIGKPANGDVYAGLDGLVAKVKAARFSRPRAYDRRQKTNIVEGVGASDKLIAIGASTGGVEALMTVLSSFPADCPPTVIVQHMPEVFTTKFAERLNRVCQPRVTEVQGNMSLERGNVYLAPGGSSHMEITGRTKFMCQLVEGDTVSGHRPSVDVLFNSVAKCAKDRAVGVILTGMGRDGAQGLLAMREAGAATIGQDQDSCVVYGMPRAAHEIGAVQHQYSLRKIATQVLNKCTDKNTQSAA